MNGNRTIEKMLRKTPLVVILGSTATGKTKLSVDLAKRFGGEIISSDSMQIYKGLDIASAKATIEEQSKAVHHMLDVCDVTTKSFTVVDFRDAALPIIDHLLKNEKLPIIVGGTNYYIESLLWKVLVSPPPDKVDSEHSASKTDHNPKTISATYNIASVDEILKELSPEQMENKDPLILHKLLETIDPARAQRLHPNDDRKVRRALEVYMNTGKSITDFFKTQKKDFGSSYLGGPLRYNHIIMFWLKSDQEKLNARIDARIDGMIAQGIIFEIRKCYNLLKKELAGKEELDQRRGMAQAIGFKEFIPYLEKYQDERFDEQITEFIKARGGISGIQNSISVADKPEGLPLLEECLEELRLRTKQYSKKQVRWLNNRFIANKGRLIPPLTVLDSTNAEINWHEDVYLKAENVVESYMKNVKADLQPLNPLVCPKNNIRMDITYFCEVCDRRFVGEYQWNMHKNSKRHQKVSRSLRKKEAQQRKVLAEQGVIRKIFHSILWWWNWLKQKIIRPI